MNALFAKLDDGSFKSDRLGIWAFPLDAIMKGDLVNYGDHGAQVHGLAELVEMDVSMITSAGFQIRYMSRDTILRHDERGRLSIENAINKTNEKWRK